MVYLMIKCAICGKTHVNNLPSVSKEYVGRCNTHADFDGTFTEQYDSILVKDLTKVEFGMFHDHFIIGYGITLDLTKNIKYYLDMVNMVKSVDEQIENKGKTTKNPVNLYPRDVYHAYKVHISCGSELLLKKLDIGLIALHCPKCDKILKEFAEIRDMTSSEICNYL